MLLDPKDSLGLSKTYFLENINQEQKEHWESWSEKNLENFPLKKKLNLRKKLTS